MTTRLPALICALLVGGSLGRFVVQRPEDSSELSNTSPVKYVITGQKDTHGQWTEEVKMEHGEEDWHIEVDHMTLDVGGGQPKVKISATFSAKSQTTPAVKVTPQDGDGGVTTGTVFQLFPRSDRDWYGAKTQCEQWGGHLAVPDTRAKMRELTAILRKHVEDIGESTGAFLGFDDVKQEGHFKTVLGKPLFSSQDSTWSPYWYKTGQPDDDKSWTTDGEDCGSFRPNGGLNDVPCRYKLPFICEKTTVAVIEQAVDVEGEEGTISNSVVREEEENEEEGELQLFKHPTMNWFEAMEACGEWGGHLALPDSEAKMLKMAKMLKASTETSGSAFLGFNDIEKEGQFVTIFGKSVFSSGSGGWSPKWFSSTQPDDDKGWTTQGEDCGSIHPSGALNDVPCLYQLPYFCEKSGSHVAVPPPFTSDDDDDVSEQSGDVSLDELVEEDTLVLFSREDLSWFQANQACGEWGGHLAVPDSARKMEVMSLKMMLADVTVASLGFGDQEQEGRFVTLFGKPVFNPEMSWSPHWWREDQPDDYKNWLGEGEDCGAVRSGGGLDDVTCRNRLPFFCEKPLAAAAAGVLDSEERNSHTSDESMQVDDDQVYTLVRLPNNEPPSIVVISEDEESSSSSTEESLSQLLSAYFQHKLDDTTITDQRSREKGSSISTDEGLLDVQDLR